VLLLEAGPTVGGGMRSCELTLPGFQHDVCSTVFALGAASPFFRGLPLGQLGVRWVHGAASMAHPLDSGQVITLENSLEETARQLGEDGPAYRRLMEPLVENWEKLMETFLGPLPLPPRYPLLAARAGWHLVQSLQGLAERKFRSPAAKALLAGLAGHAVLPLNKIGSAAPGLMLGLLGHSIGWPVVAGGSQVMAEALAGYIRQLGGTVQTDFHVRSLAELPPARAYLFDVTPQQLLAIAGEKLPDRYRRQLERYRYGPGVFKVDYALSEPVPWQASECRRAITLHLGGTLEEIAASEQQMWQGEHPNRPYILFVQSSLFDPERAPAGQHTAWAYCHVPHGSTRDMTAEIEAQIERYAPGFKEVVLARHTKNTADFQAYNANYIGGDIIGGVQDLRQQFFRPVPSLTPYRTPAKGIYLCSSSTPPGGGVHGMSGHLAAKTVLRDFR
jgi:phytoene dehydrogenase-like protein